MGRKKRKRRLGQATICICGGPKIYSKCCKPLHRGEALPEDAVTLMKSRYTAYEKGLVDYVIETTDPDGDAWEADEAKWRDSIETFGETFEFTGVEILDSDESEDSATVTFRAGLRANGKDESFVETSHFTRRAERWLYTSGDVSES